MKYCIGCGKMIETDADFCPECEARRAAGEMNTAPKATCPMEEKAPSMWVFFGFMLLFAIPIVGFIAALVMSFSLKSKTLKNYSRASVVYSVVVSVISILLTVFAIGNIITGIGNIADEFYYDGRYYDYDKSFTLPFDGMYDDRL